MKVRFTSHPTKKQASHIIMSEVIEQLNRIFEETRYEVPIIKNLLRHITSISVKNQRLSAIDGGSLKEEEIGEMLWGFAQTFKANALLLIE